MPAASRQQSSGPSLVSGALAVCQPLVDRAARETPVTPELDRRDRAVACLLVDPGRRHVQKLRDFGCVQKALCLATLAHQHGLPWLVVFTVFSEPLRGWPRLSRAARRDYISSAKPRKPKTAWSSQVFNLR